MARQSRIVRGLLSTARLERMVEAEQLPVGEIYTVAEMLADLRAGLWSELDIRAPVIDPARQAVQRHHVEALTAGEDDKDAYTRGLMRGEAESLLTELNRKLTRVEDPTTRGHMLAVIAMLNEGLGG